MLATMDTRIPAECFVRGQTSRHRTHGRSTLHCPRIMRSWRLRVSHGSSLQSESMRMLLRMLLLWRRERNACHRVWSAGHRLLWRMLAPVGANGGLALPAHVLEANFLLRGRRVLARTAHGRLESCFGLGEGGNAFGDGLVFRLDLLHEADLSRGRAMPESTRRVGAGSARRSGFETESTGIILHTVLLNGSDSRVGGWALEARNAVHTRNV